MSVFSTALVGDPVARILAGLADHAPAPRGPFAGLAVDTTQTTVPTRHGTVGCTVYRAPGGTAAGQPVYVNVHGGGFVIRYPQQDDPWCRYLAIHGGVTVVNVDYATAPGHRFPVPAEQVYDVVKWAADPGRDWDGSRLCVGGQSAGGNLTAAAARQSLQEGGPPIALQVLHYPVLDLVTPPRDKPLTGSSAVPRWMSEVFDGCYIRDPRMREHPLASPAWGTNADGIEGIAPALVITAEHDYLRAEGQAYAGKLAAAGALAEYRDVPGVHHGYDIRGESADATRQSYELMAGHVSRAVAAA